MRRSLFSSLPILFLIACNGNAGNSPMPAGEAVADSGYHAHPAADPDTSETVITVSDEAVIDLQEENPSVNSGSKAQKTSKAEGTNPTSAPEVPGSGVRTHGAPGKSELDSLKEAKSKGKK